MAEHITESPDYKSFRSSVPQRKVIVDGGHTWTFYDAGPRSINNPIIFLPPVSGTADIFFRQLLSLSGSGIRALAVNHPVVWNADEWCRSFNNLLNYLDIDRVHLFGASLGGFLAQKYAEHSGNGRRVRSMILCNAFNDTDVFHQTKSSSSFWAVPAVVLKKAVMGSFENGPNDLEMRQSVDFMVEKLDSLSQKELASRLTINCHSSYVIPQNVQVLSSDVTLMNVFDEHALSTKVQNEMYKMYPASRRALLKTGGNFPYLSRSDEVNLFIQVHLQQFNDTIYSAMEAKQYDGNTNSPASSSKLKSEQAFLSSDEESIEATVHDPSDTDSPDGHDSQDGHEAIGEKRVVMMERCESLTLEDRTAKEVVETADITHSIDDEVPRPMGS